MKYIPVSCCGVCPNNTINISSKNWVNYCSLIDKPVERSVIHKECPLEDLEKNDSYRS